MNRDKRIEKVNAFRKLLDTTLKGVTKDEELQKEIQEQFRLWVSAQLDELMGNERPDALTTEEIAVLKSFVKKATAKVSNPTAPAANVVQAKPEQQRNEAIRTQNERPRREQPETGKPLGDRLKGRPMSLEDLDNEGPNY